MFAFKPVDDELEIPEYDNPLNLIDEEVRLL